MVPVTQQAHLAIQAVVKLGDHVIDATAGNGHDTLFLSQLVGPTGRVFAFDIQQQAIEATQQRLTETWGNPSTSLQTSDQEIRVGPVSLFHRSHAEMDRCLPQELHGRITAVMFNLGYLPGGEKSVITTSDQTVKALQIASALLKPGGLISVVVYSGHPGGLEEAKQVENWCYSLSNQKWQVHPEFEDERFSSLSVQEGSRRPFLITVINHCDETR